jgi:hypothetical protein
MGADEIDFVGISSVTTQHRPFVSLLGLTIVELGDVGSFGSPHSGVENETVSAPAAADRHFFVVPPNGTCHSDDRGYPDKGKSRRQRTACHQAPGRDPWNHQMNTLISS